MIINYKEILQSIKDSLKNNDVMNSMAIRHMMANLYVPIGEDRSAEELMALLQCKLMYNYVELDKIQGSLIGGAAGDALGFAVEFLDDYRIFEKYGENGITSYFLSNNIAHISDDTQMTLFTTEGLLRASRKFNNPTDDQFIEFIYESYLGWLHTQEGDSKVLPYSDSLLSNVEELYNRRAPGRTCISALASGHCGTYDKHLNHSKGCGGVMRVAPIALYLAQLKNYDKLDEIADVAARSSAITHSHPLGFIPSAYLAVLIACLLRGDFPGKALHKAEIATRKYFANSEYTEYCLKLVNKAISLAWPEDEDDRIADDLDAIRELGEGWVAEETLAIALYCSLKYLDDENGFEKALIASVNHSGDSDSTGAVTGNIMGAILGYKNIPDKFKNNLELHDVILDISEKMHINKLDIDR